MKKYKFRLSETNWIEFTQKDLDNAKTVNYVDDNSKGKILPIKRQFDGKIYDIIIPVELIEEQKNEQLRKNKGYDT